MKEFTSGLLQAVTIKVNGQKKHTSSDVCVCACTEYVYVMCNWERTQFEAGLHLDSDFRSSTTPAALL